MRPPPTAGQEGAMGKHLELTPRLRQIAAAEQRARRMGL